MSLQLLGSTTSGVSLFASGINLRALTPAVSIPIVASTASRLCGRSRSGVLRASPGRRGRGGHERLGCGARHATHGDADHPARPIHKIAEKESASVLSYNYLFSAVSMTSAVLLSTCFSPTP